VLGEQLQGVGLLCLIAHQPYTVLPVAPMDGVRRRPQRILHRDAASTPEFQLRQQFATRLPQLNDIMGMDRHSKSLIFLQHRHHRMPHLLHCLLVDPCDDEDRLAIDFGIFDHVHELDMHA